MIQNVTAAAGQSTLVAALCRLLVRNGVAVAPFQPGFKPISAMENRVTALIQAQAARISPCDDMAPALFMAPGEEPQRSVVMDAYLRMAQRFDAIIIEGADDLHSREFAEAIACPVILVADSDRLGVGDHIAKTLDDMPRAARQRVIGIVINRYNKDMLLMGRKWLALLEQQTGKPVLALMPYLPGLFLETHESMTMDAILRVIVVDLPAACNLAELDVLRLRPEVRLQLIGAEQPIPDADLIILPDSKNSRSALEWLRRHRWSQALYRHIGEGGKVIGLSAGYRMLGKNIIDPQGLEGARGMTHGLDLLDIDTLIETEYAPVTADGVQTLAQAQTKAYYAGTALGPGLNSPAFQVDGQAEGVLSADHQTIGTCLHGLFDHPHTCALLLDWAGLKWEDEIDAATRRDASLNRLADAAQPLLKALLQTGM